MNYDLGQSISTVWRTKALDYIISKNLSNMFLRIAIILNSSHYYIVILETFKNPCIKTSHIRQQCYKPTFLICKILLKTSYRLFNKIRSLFLKEYYLNVHKLYDTPDEWGAALGLQWRTWTRFVHYIVLLSVHRTSNNNIANSINRIIKI